MPTTPSAEKRQPCVHPVHPPPHSLQPKFVYLIRGDPPTSLPYCHYSIAFNTVGNTVGLDGTLKKLEVCCVGRVSGFFEALSQEKTVGAKPLAEKRHPFVQPSHPHKARTRAILKPRGP